MKNKYVNRSKISEAKFRELVRFFSIDLTAIQISELTGLNRNTVNRYLNEIRKKIAGYSEATSPMISARITKDELTDTDECLILIAEFDDKVYTTVAERTFVKRNGSTVDGYDLIIDLGTGKHTFNSQNERQPIQSRKKRNRLESFWGYAKSRLTKFKGLHSSTFRYHLKECEFRYNYRQDDIYQLLLKILRKDPLF